jgi:hypothetical protein
MAEDNGKYLNNIVSDLPQELQDEFLTVKASYHRHKVVRTGFENKVRAYLGETKLKFSYRYGQLSAEFAEPKATKAPAKPRQSLSDWLEQNQQH